MRRFAMAIVLFPGSIAATAQQFLGTTPSSFPGPDLLTRSFTYGPEAGQVVDFGRPAGLAKAPLIVQINDAGWVNGANVSFAWLNSLLIGKGYAYASVATRTKGDTRLAERVADAVAGIARLVADAEARQIDASRITLVAKGSGATIAALIATDPDLLTSAGVNFGVIRGVYLLGPSGLELSPTVRPARSPDFIFGDPVTRAKLSPSAHVALPNAPAFLIQVDDHDAVGGRTARAYANSLSAAGTRVEVQAVPQMIRSATTLGVIDNAATRGLLAFLAGLD